MYKAITESTMVPLLIAVGLSTSIWASELKMVYVGQPGGAPKANFYGAGGNATKPSHLPSITGSQSLPLMTRSAPLKPAVRSATAASGKALPSMTTSSRRGMAAIVFVALDPTLHSICCA